MFFINRENERQNFSLYMNQKDKNNLVIFVIARKGVGKSAFMKWIFNNFEAYNTLQINPSINSSSPFSEGDYFRSLYLDSKDRSKQGHVLKYNSVASFFINISKPFFGLREKGTLAALWITFKSPFLAKLIIYKMLKIC